VRRVAQAVRESATSTSWTLPRPPRGTDWQSLKYATKTAARRERRESRSGNGAMKHAAEHRDVSVPRLPPSLERFHDHVRRDHGRSRTPLSSELNGVNRKCARSAGAFPASVDRSAPPRRSQKRRRSSKPIMWSACAWGEKHGVDPVELFAQRLQAQLGRGVDEQVRFRRRD